VAHFGASERRELRLVQAAAVLQSGDIGLVDVRFASDGRLRFSDRFANRAQGQTHASLGAQLPAKYPNWFAFRRAVLR